MPGGGAVYYYDESGAGITIDAGPLELISSLEGSKVIGAAPSPGPFAVAATVLGSASISVSVSPGALTATLSLEGDYALPVFEDLEDGFFIIGKIEDRVIA